MVHRLALAVDRCQLVTVRTRTAGYCMRPDRNPNLVRHLPSPPLSHARTQIVCKRVCVDVRTQSGLPVISGLPNCWEPPSHARLQGACVAQANLTLCVYGSLRGARLRGQGLEQRFKEDVLGRE